MDVDITNMPSLRVAAVRHIGPYPQISMAVERLAAIAGPAGLFGQPGAEGIAIYHDDPESTAPDQLRSDAGVVVPDGVALPPGLTEQRIPAGRHGHTRHVGPYEQLSDVWARFKGEWAKSGHRRGPGASYEIYRNDPRTTPKAQLITDIYVPMV
jgi:AraC family transcriptional regulator